MCATMWPVRWDGFQRLISYQKEISFNLSKILGGALDSYRCKIAGARQIDQKYYAVGPVIERLFRTPSSIVDLEHRFHQLMCM